MRYGFARKVDTNHKLIGDAFRRCGFKVLDLSRLRKGAPDYLVQLCGFWALVEVKTEKGKLEPDQEKFHAEWPVLVIRTVEEVTALRQRIL